MAQNGVVYSVAALLKVDGGKKAISQMERLGQSISRRSAALNGLGKSIAGTTIQTTKLMAKMAAGTAVLAGAGGFGALVKSGMSFNAQLEQSRYKMAATLNLFGHAQGNFSKNMEISAAVQQRIFDMAAKSPASFAQAEQMFSNMLPGARSITGDMYEILALQEKSLSLGLITGDFATTGSQLSRILTGGAGAEMETWRQVLQTPIKEAAKDMKGMKHLGKLTGDKLTQAFNKLDGGKRFALVQKAMESLPTEELGKSWMGVSSTLISNAGAIKKAMGEAAFEALKSRVAKLVGKGGLMDPKGETMAKLTLAAQTVGNALGKYIDPMIDVLSKWVKDFSDNWPRIINDLQNAFNTGLATAKLFLKVAVARAATGGILQAAGGAGGAVGGAASLAGRVFGKDSKGNPSRAMRMGASGAALMSGEFRTWKRGAGKAGGFGKKGASIVGEKMGKILGGKTGMLGHFAQTIGGALSHDSGIWSGVKDSKVGRGSRKVGGLLSGIAGEGITKVMTSFGSVFASVTPALMTAVPLMGVFAGIIGVGLLGALGLIIAPIAYLIDNMGSLVKMFKSGQISLTPLLNALEEAWDGFVKVGEALIGDIGSADGAQKAIDLMTSAVDGLVQGVYWGIKFIGLFQMAMNGFTYMIKAFAYLIYTIVDEVLGLVQSVTDKMGITPEWLVEAQNYTEHGKSELKKSADQDKKEAFQIWDAADKMLEGVASGKLAKKLAEAQEKEKKKTDLNAGGKGGRSSTSRQGSGKGATVNINKMVVNNDLRNQDPDRVIGAFNNAFMKAVTHRTQSTKLQPGGI